MNSDRSSSLSLVLCFLLHWTLCSQINTYNDDDNDIFRVYSIQLCMVNIFLVIICWLASIKCRWTFKQILIEHILRTHCVCSAWWVCVVNLWIECVWFGDVKKVDSHMLNLWMTLLWSLMIFQHVTFATATAGHPYVIISISLFNQVKWRF